MHPRPHLLALVTDAFGGYGGIAQYNRDLLSAFAACSQDLHIDVLPRLTPSTLEPLPSNLTQHPPVFSRIKYALKATLLAFKHRPTVIFCGHLYHGPLARWLAKRTGAKLISQVHGTEIWGDISPYFRIPLESSDIVLTVSRNTRSRVLAKADIDPEKVLVLNNTVGADFVPGDRPAARRLFGLNDEFTILTVARLDAREGYKGHDRIIPLLSQLSKSGKPVRYLIAGIGDDQPRLEQLAKTQHVETLVRFLGKVPREQLPDLYRAADLFALPSTGEGFGIAFLEAMACGTPAIGLATGGSPDALGDGKLGACVPEENFAPALLNLSAATQASEKDLAAQVTTRYGQTAFTAQCALIVSAFLA